MLKSPPKIMCAFGNLDNQCNKLPNQPQTETDRLVILLDSVFTLRIVTIDIFPYIMMDMPTVYIQYIVFEHLKNGHMLENAKIEFCSAFSLYY